MHSQLAIPPHQPCRGEVQQLRCEQHRRDDCICCANEHLQADKGGGYRYQTLHLSCRSLSCCCLILLCLSVPATCQQARSWITTGMPKGKFCTTAAMLASS